MDLVSRTLRWQRAALAALLFGSAVGFWRASYDVFNTFKATVIVVGAIVVAAAAAVRVSRTRRLLLPATPVWWAVGAFCLALVVATAVSDRPALSVVGRPGRHTGLALYLVYVFLFGAVLRLYRDRSPADLVKVLMAAAAPAAAYGLLQATGVEPLGWETVEGGPPVFSTFGNANFFAAYLGIVFPLCLWGGLTLSWSPAGRATALIVGALSLAAAVATTSLQGVAAAAVGTAVVGGVWLWTSQDRRVRRLRAPLTAAGVILGFLAVTAVATGAGPLDGVRANAARSLETRLGKWETALLMFRDRPVLGSGLETFADWFHAYRPDWLAAETGLRRTTDTPHNVPLDMLTSGGLLLAVSYLAVVAFVAWALVVGLRRLEGEQRLLLAGLGGAWLAYQAQSLVSIDVPPLAVLNWVLAGAVVVVATPPRLAEITLPGAPALPKPRPGRRRKAKPRPVPLAPANPALLAGVGIAALAALWVATTPIRADLAAGQALRLGARGDVEAAIAAYERAAATAAWEARYPAQQGGYLSGLGREEQALAAHQEAARREPRGLAHAINLARLSAELGRHDQAARWYQQTLAIDPKTPEVLVEVGRYRLSRDDVDDATALLERAVALRGDEADWWVALGRARSADGDVPGARAAFRRALDLEPGSQEARQALGRLA